VSWYHLEDWELENIRKQEYAGTGSVVSATVGLQKTGEGFVPMSSPRCECLWVEG
jgi:hypothetical protein